MSLETDDFRLITDCINGNPESWENFVKRYSRLVYHSILHTFKNYSFRHEIEDIEDIHNSIFLSLIENDFRKLRQFEAREGCSLSSWIRLISVRSTIDFLRNQNRHITFEKDFETIGQGIEMLPDSAMSADKQIELSEKQRIFKGAVNELPASDKLFMKLYYEKELSEEEIAHIMNVSISAIYSKKNRIREKIKKYV
jgi:RNA polymerase sigma factor (sigma-70 family)